MVRSRLSVHPAAALAALAVSGVAAAQPSTKRQPPAEVASAEAGADRSEPSSWSTPRKAALALAGGGVVALALGAGFGISALGLDSDARRQCPADACSVAGAARANHLRDKAEVRALQANLTLGLAGAAVVGASVLWFIGGPPEPDTQERRAGVAVRPVVGMFTGVTLDGHF